MKTHTFSDGTTVPAGTLVCVSPVSIYCDEENYPDAGKFKPFRFVEQPDAKRQFTATSIEHGNPSNNFQSAFI